MSDNNTNITDQQLRGLLNQILLDETPDCLTLHKLTEIEAKIVCTSKPLHETSFNKEKEFLNKLESKFDRYKGLNRFFNGLALVLIISFLLIKINASNKNDSKDALYAQTEKQAFQKSHEDEVKQLNHSGKNNAMQQEPHNPITIYGSDSINTLRNDLSLPAQPEIENSKAISARIDYPEYEQTGEPHKKTSVAVGSMHIDTLFSGIKKLEVNGKYCDINIRAIPGDDLIFKGAIKITTKGWVIKRGSETIMCERDGEILKVWMESTGKSSWVLGGTYQIDASLDFDVPVKTLVDVSNEDGDIGIKGLQADIHVESGYGNLSLIDIQGNIKSNCSSGNITLRNVTGDIDLTAGYGNVNLNNLKGNLHIHSKSGDLFLTKITGNSYLNSGYGNQQLSDLTGNLTSIVTSGNVKLSILKGNLNIKADYGNVELLDCKGNIYLNVESGSIKGNNISLTDSLQMKTNYGNINMHLNNNMSELSFDLQTAYGKIKINKEGSHKVVRDGKLVIGKGRIIVKGYTQSGDLVFE